MNTLATVGVNIVESLATSTSIPSDCILTKSMLVALVSSKDTLVDHFNADTILIWIEIIETEALTISADGICWALNVVASVAVATVQNAVSVVTLVWNMIVLANTLVAIALFDTPSIGATWVRVTLVSIAALVIDQIVARNTLTFKTVAFIEALSILRATVTSSSTLVNIITNLNTLVVLHLISFLTLARKTDAVINA